MDPLPDDVPQLYLLGPRQADLCPGRRLVSRQRPRPH